MVYVNLISEKITNVQITIDIPKDKKIDIEGKFNIKMDYKPDNRGGIAKLKQTLVYKEDPSMFSVSVECVGFFEIEGIMSEKDKTEAHLQAYNLLFPYVQSMIAFLTASAGISPIMLRQAKLSAEDVAVNTDTQEG